jgi:hypothetical protein
LSNIVSDFVSLLGYWTVSFTLILLIEDRWFRRTERYNLNVWDIPSKLPWGAAAVFALLCGYCCGGVTGMAQTWYIGKFWLQCLFLIFITNKHQVPSQQSSAAMEVIAVSTCPLLLLSSFTHRRDGMNENSVVVKSFNYLYSLLFWVSGFQN